MAYFSARGSVDQHLLAKHPEQFPEELEDFVFNYNLLTEEYHLKRTPGELLPYFVQRSYDVNETMQEMLTFHCDLQLSSRPPSTREIVFPEATTASTSSPAPAPKPSSKSQKKKRKRNALASNDNGLDRPTDAIFAALAVESSPPPHPPPPPPVAQELPISLSPLIEASSPSPATPPRPPSPSPSLPPSPPPTVPMDIQTEVSLSPEEQGAQLTTALSSLHEAISKAVSILSQHGDTFRVLVTRPSLADAPWQKLPDSFRTFTKAWTGLTATTLPRLPHATPSGPLPPRSVPSAPIPAAPSAAPPPPLPTTAATRASRSAHSRSHLTNITSVAAAIAKACPSLPPAEAI